MDSKLVKNIHARLLCTILKCTTGRLANRALVRHGRVPVAAAKLCAVSLWLADAGIATLAHKRIAGTTHLSRHRGCRIQLLSKPCGNVRSPNQPDQTDISHAAGYGCRPKFPVYLSWHGFTFANFLRPATGAKISVVGSANWNQRQSQTFLARDRTDARLHPW